MKIIVKAFLISFSLAAVVAGLVPLLGRAIQFIEMFIGFIPTLGLLVGITFVAVFFLEFKNVLEAEKEKRS